MDRVAIVTGAAGNLGREVAARLASGGFTIVAIGHGAAERLPPAALALGGVDLGDEASAAAALAKVGERFGQVTALVNAFNLMDNLDGAAATVAAVSAASIAALAAIGDDLPLAVLATALAGALIGFLCFNFPPATIFMGDSGSLVVGFLMGVLTVRTTFLPKGEDFAAGWYAVFAPLIVLALPLYDLIVVSLIRLSRGKSPFQGDTNHFSHRLVRRGMSKRTAVLCLWLVTATTSIAATLSVR